MVYSIRLLKHYILENALSPATLKSDYLTVCLLGFSCILYLNLYFGHWCGREESLSPQSAKRSIMLLSCKFHACIDLDL